MEIRMPHLNEWQQTPFDEIREAKYDTFVVKAKRQVGKSILAITAMLYFAFADRSLSTCVEPTLKQCRRVFKQIINACGGEGSKLIKSSNQTLLTIEFFNGSEIVLMSAEQEDALRGATVKKGILVIDEAAFIEDAIFEILYPLVDANHCPVLLISTPLFMSGEFYKKYTEGLNPAIVKSYDWSKFDTSIYLSPEKLEYYRQTISPLKFKSEYLGQFIAEGSYIFGQVTDSVKPLSTKPPVYGGLDWSCGNDNDFTVLILMDIDGNVTNVYPYKNFTPTQLVDRIAQDIKRHPSLNTVQVETNSIGTVYLDFLKQKVSGGMIQGFNTSNESKRRIIENLIKAFQEHSIGIPNDPEMIKQLQHYAMEKTPTGKVTYNGQNGVNDDYVLALAFVYDLYKRNAGTFTLSFA